MSDLVADMLGELEPQQQQPMAASTAGQPMAATGDLVNDSLSQLETQQQQPAQKVQGGGTPDNPFQGIITFSQKIQEARQVGQMGFRESALGHAVADGRMTLEEAERQIAADDKAAMLSDNLEAYEKEAWGSWLTGIPTSIALSTAKQLPMLEESLKVGAMAGVPAGGAMAATGAGIPVAAPVGFSVGTVAAAAWTGNLIKGQEYLNYRRQGLEHKEALGWASLSGNLQGCLAGLQFGSAAKVPVTAAGNILKAHAQSMVQFLGEYVKFGAIQIGLAEAQTATKLMTDAIAGTVDKVPGMVPTLEKAAKEFGATFMEMLKASTGLFLGGKVIGKTAGITIRTGGDVVRVFRKAHDTHLEKQAAKIEAIKMAEEGKPGEQQPTETQTETAEQKSPSKSAQDKQRQAAERLQKRQAAESEVKRIFAAMQSRFFIEKPETRLQETNRIQRVLKRMVTKSDKLDDTMKARLLARVPEIDGVAALVKEGERFIDDLRGREHANELKAAEARLHAAIKSGQEKGKKAALPLATQASLKWFQEFFTPPKAEPRAAEPGARAAGEPEARAMNEPETSKAQERGAKEPGAKTAQDAFSSDQKAQARQKAADFVDRGIQEEAKQLTEQVDKLDNNELAELFNQPAELLEKRRIAMLAEQYWGGAMDAEGIKRLAGEIEETVKTGKSEFLEKKKAEAQKLLAKRQQVLEGVQGIKPVTPSTSKAAPKEMTGLGKVLNSLTKTSSALWDKLLQDTPAEARQKLVADILDFTGTENREAAINIRAAEKLTELYTKAVGTMRETNRLLRNGTRNELFEQKFTDADGNSQILGRATLNELAYLHNAFNDPGAIPGLIDGNGYTLDGMVEPGHTSTQEAVRQILTEREGGKYLKLAESIKDFYRWFAPGIANHYLKEYGIVLPMDPDYSGQIFHRQLERIKNAGDLMEDVHQFAKRSLDPGSTKKRSNSRLPIRMVDPFVQVQRHRGEMAFWIANSEKARELSFIFSDTTKDGLRDVIQHKLGREFTSLVDGRLAFQFHLKPGIMDIADGPLQTVKSNLATGLLGARIDQAPKQWTSILTALSTNNYGEFVDGLRGAADKNRMREYLSRSELYKDRQNELLPQILEATKDRGYADAVTGDRALALKQFFLIPMSKWGDGVASAISGFVEFNRVRKSGGTVEEAVLAGDSLVDRSQSSSRAAQKVPGEFKGGVANLSLAFAKQNIQMLNLESGAIRDWFIHKDDVHLARAVRTMAAIHAAQALFQAINSVPAFIVGDEKEQHDAQLRILSAALFGSYTALPLVGFDVVYGALSGFKGTQEPRTIIGGLAGDSAKLLKRVYTIIKKSADGDEISGEDWINAFKSTAAVASVATGLPFWGLFKYTTLGSKVVEKAQGQ